VPTPRGNSCGVRRRHRIPLRSIFVQSSFFRFMRGAQVRVRSIFLRRLPSTHAPRGDPGVRLKVQPAGRPLRQGDVVESPTPAVQTWEFFNRVTIEPQNPKRNRPRQERGLFLWKKPRGYTLAYGGGIRSAKRLAQHHETRPGGEVQAAPRGILENHQEQFDRTRRFTLTQAAGQHHRRPRRLLGYSVPNTFAGPRT